MLSITSHINRKNAFVFSLMLSVFVMPFPFVIQNIVFLLTGLLWLIQGENYGAAFRYSFSWWLWLFFLLHVVSVFHSINTHEAWLAVERRLPFALLPLFIFHPIVNDYLPHLKRAFILGVASALILLFGIACWRFYGSVDTSVFFYHTFSQPIRMHAVYLAAYSLFALVMLNTSKQTLFNSKWLLPLHVILGLGLVLLSSKLMLVLALIFAVVLIGVRQEASREKRTIAVVFTTALLLVISFTAPIKERFLKEISSDFAVVKQEQFKYDTPFSGTSLRLVIWKQCQELLNKEKAWLFGVGSGDAQDLLNQSYQHKGMYTGNPDLHDTGYLGYGPHNSYIETLFSLGLIGLCALVAMMFNLYLKLKRQLLGILFLTIVCSFFLTESVLSTNKGIVFFTLFSCLLVNEISNTKNSVVNTRKNS